MRDLKRYWKEVRDLERNLPAWVWLMSLEDPMRGQAGGTLAEVPAAPAAKLLHAKSHRPATAEEIRVYLEKRSATVQLEFHESLRRKGISIVAVADQPGPERPARDHPPTCAKI